MRLWHVLTLVGCLTVAAHAQVHGWLNWRGPGQNGVSAEVGLPETIDEAKPLWSLPISSRGTPVIAHTPRGDRLYLWGYTGEREALREGLWCIEADTGKVLWQHMESDFLSDVVYDRYAIGAPTVDPRTGNIYWLTSAGLFSAFTPDGKMLWQHSMMEEFGRLTFPNGRTGAPIIDEDLVIIQGITGNWGSDGPARNRYYAFDTATGELVWSSTPGTQPKDSTFSTPILSYWNGQRVLYAGTGCGHVVAINARNGKPLWRFLVSMGGVNASVVLHRTGPDDAPVETIITMHNDENPDSSESGRVQAFRVPRELPAPANSATTTPAPGEPVTLPTSAEVWRHSIRVATSSPTLVGDTVYITDLTGELHAIDVPTGRKLWSVKLAPNQLHASPLFADGRLYVPFQNGLLAVIKPTAEQGQVISRTMLQGHGLGQPVAWRGRVYVTTSDRLYCFGHVATASETDVQLKSRQPTTTHSATWPLGHLATSLQIVPSEVMLKAGQTQTFRYHQLDDLGNQIPMAAVHGIDPKQVTWQPYVPPGARVRSAMDATFDEAGVLTAQNTGRFSAGAFRATLGELAGTMRGRVVPNLPYNLDFENHELTEPHPSEKDAQGNPVKYAYPPLSWIGARFRFEVRADPATPAGETPTNKVLAKTIDNIFFQRGFLFVGHPDMHNYTVTADVMTDGNRRMMSDVGIINQRYVVALLGNSQVLQVVSNQDRVNVTVPFKVEPKVWYRLKARVDRNEDGTGVVRAKAWKRGEPEPENWTLEAPQKVVHTKGAPGAYGFALQSRFRVYLDNYQVVSNQ